MKILVFALCMVGLAGWAGTVATMDGPEPGVGGLGTYTIAGPETLAVADSGYLFMYGNEIERPFVFTIELDTVRINGIPYRPRPQRRKPRVDTGWSPPAPSPEREDLVLKAKALGEKLLFRGGQYSDVVDSVTKVFRSSPLVVEAREGGIAVSVEFKDVNGFYLLGLPVTSPPRVRDWEEIWVEARGDIATQYAVVLMEPYDLLEEQVTELSFRLHEQGAGYEDRIQAMGDMLRGSELVERADVKPEQYVINVYYKGISGSYALGVREDPTEQPLYLTDPAEARRIALEESRRLALRLASSLSTGSFVIVGPGDLAVGGPDRFRYLEAARRIGRGEGTEDDQSLMGEAFGSRLMKPMPLGEVVDNE